MSDETKVIVEDRSELWLRLLSIPVEERLDALVADQGVDPTDAQAVAWLQKNYGPIVTGRDGVSEAVDLLIKEDVYGRIREGLLQVILHARTHVPDLVVPPSLAVSLALQQPYDDGEPEELLSGANGPDLIWLTCWPTADNVGHVGAAAAHELNHILRSLNAPPAQPFSLVDWVVSEGLAEAFVVEIFGDEGVFLDYAAPDDPQLEATWETVVGAFDLAGDYGRMMAYVLGDPTARRHGGTLAGAPHMAGYAVGKVIVDRFLAGSGLTATEALRVPTSDILAAGV